MLICTASWIFAHSSKFNWFKTAHLDIHFVIGVLACAAEHGSDLIAVLWQHLHGLRFLKILHY